MKDLLIFLFEVFDASSIQNSSLNERANGVILISQNMKLLQTHKITQEKFWTLLPFFEKIIARSF